MPAVRAIVTGGAGFIGSHLVDALIERGDEVVVVDDLSSGRRENVNPAARLEQRDIRAGFDALDADAVFHLAAQADVQVSMRRPAHDAEINVVGTISVLEAARAAGARAARGAGGGGGPPPPPPPRGVGGGGGGAGAGGGGPPPKSRSP